MSNRLVSPVLKPNSQFYWFRLVVPERYRQAVGKREIWKSLETSDLGEARRKCAARQQEWLDRFKRIEEEIAGRAAVDAVLVVDSYLDAEACRVGSLDRVVSHELKNLALAESSAFFDDDLLSDGDFVRDVVADGAPAYSGLDGFVVELRRDTLRNCPDGAILTGVEAAHRIEAAGLWEMTEGYLVEAFEHAGVRLPTDTETVAVAARHFLRRLLDHRQPALDAYRSAFPGLTAPDARPFAPAAEAEAPIAPAPVPIGIDAELREAIFGEAVNARTITEVFQAWADTRPREQAKLVDEWRKAISRFVALWGDAEVAAITYDMVEGFRNALQHLPARAPKKMASLPILEQVRLARENNLPCLSGPTVAKSVSGIRVILEYARDKLKLIKVNPAKLVSVENAKSEINARVAFDENELVTIFASPMMIDPAKRSDDEFWCTLLAPLSGLRSEEMATVRPANVKRERGIWYISVELDTRRVRKNKTAAGETNKTGKTRNAFRDVPLHWLLLEAGFLEFVDRQRERCCEWLFDNLEADRYGKRSNFMSRRLNRYIRGLGITEEEKVFYSFRHSMKRACRNSKMKEEISDLLAGHAPLSVSRKYGAGARAAGRVGSLHECGRFRAGA